MRDLSLFIGLLSTVLPATVAAQAPGERYSLHMVFGSDTVAIEHVVRTADRVEVDMLNLEEGIRHRFTLDLTATAAVHRLTDRMYRDAESAQPDQVAVFTFRGDSVEVTLQGDTPRTVTVGTTEDALPLIVPSSTMIEQALLRSRNIGGGRSSIPVFNVVTAQTAEAVIEWNAPDTARVRLDEALMTAEMTSDGRLRGVVFLGGVRRVTRSPQE